MTIKSLLPPKSEIANQHDYTDQEIDDYMQTAARMLFDIIHDYQKRLSEAGRPTKQNISQDNGKKDI